VSFKTIKRHTSKKCLIVKLQLASHHWEVILGLQIKPSIRPSFSTISLPLYGPSTHVTFGWGSQSTPSDPHPNPKGLFWNCRQASNSQFAQASVGNLSWLAVNLVVKQLVIQRRLINNTQ